MASPYEQGGITGGQQNSSLQQLIAKLGGGKLSGGTAGPATAPVDAPPIQAPEPAPTAPAAPAPALDFGRMTGYDEGKFNANKQDAKYQMGRTLAQFDPRQGFTPDALAALNKLGYGNFTSDGGDGLNLSGLTDLGRQNKLTGDYHGADFIQGYKSGNGKWAYADPYAEAQQAKSAPQGSGGMPSLGGGLTPMLPQGDAQGNIQQALASLQQPGMLQQLIAALSGGGQ